ncbi:MAG TPA: gamma-glutamylcyclotransferase family protein [Pedobacter sp.]|jgi:gamma-glutamylcyclotransferase (GGCT)/AIG2-like uncharacterized protein YtfP
MFNLFIYGTLLQSENPFGKYLKENSQFVQFGKLKGRLYNIGEYPGARSDADAKSFVLGSILALNNPTETLRLMDEYEGFGIDQPQPNEYIRELIDVETETGLMKCWVYLYNLPVEKLHEIVGGDYLDYILEASSQE